MIDRFSSTSLPVLDKDRRGIIYMKTILTKPIQCQSRDCEERATWREVDKYTQQGQAFTYFYYMCDEHKEKFEQTTPGHKKEFNRLI